MVANRISADHSQLMSAPFSKLEVEETLFHMHPTMALGSDGLPALLPRFSRIICDDMTHFCFQVLNDHTSLGTINQMLLVLIPKIKKLSVGRQFQPISLCNVVFKLIIKTINNRPKLVLPDIICDTQRLAIGRLISDNALIAFECFHYMKNKFTGRKGKMMMTLKLDMSKAYDMVE